MTRDKGWDVDVKVVALTSSVALARQLEGSRYETQLQEIRREMVERLRKAGSSDQEIVDTLICNLWHGDRGDLVKEWSPVLGISGIEFKRLIRTS